MKIYRIAVVVLVFSRVALCAISTECGPNKECLIEVPGTQCADGTPSFVTLTQRPNAKKLLIYLSGGGACWSKSSCENGYAKDLTRVEEPTDWSNGTGVFNAKDARNPLNEAYNILTVPYCTGDVYSGNRTINYGTARAPYVIRHHGYGNVQKIMEKAKALFPAPEKVVLLGCSAGGIGVYYHMRTLADAFPQSPKYVVSDAGTPFKPPYVKAAAYAQVIENWGARNTLPVDPSFNDIDNFGTLIEYNAKRFPDIRFGFISSYRDRVMTFFAFAVGTLYPFSVVRDNIINVADTHMKSSRNARVFFTDSDRHCHTGNALGSMTSLDTDLGTWMSDLISDSASWNDVRPDALYGVPAHQIVVPFPWVPPPVGTN